MKREELKSAFINAIRKNDLYDGESIIIPNEIGRKFMDDFYSEMISSEECKARKRYYFNYVKKVMHEKDWYVNEITILEFINEHIHDESDFDDVKIALGASKNWSMFWKCMKDVFLFDIAERGD